MYTLRRSKVLGDGATGVNHKFSSFRNCRPLPVPLHMNYHPFGERLYQGARDDGKF